MKRDHVSWGTRARACQILSCPPPRSFSEVQGLGTTMAEGNCWAYTGVPGLSPLTLNTKHSPVPKKDSLPPYLFLSLQSVDR